MCGVGRLSTMPSVSSFKILLRENRRTFFLALPIVAGLVGQMLIGIADTIMVAATERSKSPAVSGRIRPSVSTTM